MDTPSFADSRSAGLASWSDAPNADWSGSRFPEDATVTCSGILDRFWCWLLKNQALEAFRLLNACCWGSLWGPAFASREG